MRGVSDPLAEGALFTDLYQLTMAQLYFQKGLHEKPARFEFFFRNYPHYGSHQAGYCIFAGIGSLLDWMTRTEFREEDIAPLKRQRTARRAPLFSADFLHWLQGRKMNEGLTLYSMPEGRVVHPQVPLAVVEGPLAMAQLLETPLLNHLNFETLIATKASRIREAGMDQLLIDFGLRRAHGKGANAGARAALIGGADFTSNVGVSVLLDLPPKGTHAHSMVQAFIALGGTELDAFRAFADIYPDDCVLLVDTLNTLESGVPNAIKVFEELKQKGHRPAGIRLDSGDLAYLSIQAYKQLDKAGFGDVSIILSNQVDEMVILQVLRQIREEAPAYHINPERLIKHLVYAAGTKLITSGGDPALDGIYKLVAVQNGSDWHPAMKKSETPAKSLIPGRKKVWRLYDQRHKAIGDLLTREQENPRKQDPLILRHPVDPTIQRTLRRSDLSLIEPLLDPIPLSKEESKADPLKEIRRRRDRDLDCLDPGVKRIINPHVYHVALSEQLFQLKESMLSRISREM